MSTSRERDGARTLGNQWQYLRLTAQVEAQGLGHHEVDVDHLVLALLTTGERSAPALTATGADAAGVRRAVVAVQREELAGLGAAGAVLPPPEAGPLRLEAARELKVTARVQELVDGVDPRDDDRALLSALLDDEGGRAVTLLSRTDVDLAALRTRLLDRSPAPPLPPEPVDEEGRPPAPEGRSWLDVSHRQRAAVPAPRVWALVSDPARREEWDVVATGAPAGRRAVEQVPPRVTEVAPGSAVAWERTTAPGTPATDVLRVRVDADGTGSVLQLRRSVLVTGRTWKLLRPLLSRMLRTQLRLQAQSIARAATAADGS